MPSTDQPATGLTVDVHTSNATVKTWAVSFNGDHTATLVCPRPQLLTALKTALDELTAYCTAEHENALHLGQPEPGCPMCEQEQDTELAALDVQISDVESARDTFIAAGNTDAATAWGNALTNLTEQRKALTLRTMLAEVDAEIAAAEAGRDRNVAEGRAAAAARYCDQLDVLVSQRMALVADEASTR